MLFLARHMAQLAAIVVLAAAGTVMHGQTAASSVKSDAEVQKEAQQAGDLYNGNNFAAALPLYEDLHAQRPQSNVFREQLALCLLSRGSVKEPAEFAKTQARAKALLLDAKAAGDNSNLLQIMLEKMSGATSNGVPTAKTPAQEILASAEKAFSSGDLARALTLFKQASETDPRLYEAPLFAGDAEYKLNHYDAAGAWYAKAIVMNPDRETAYRYWGDVLSKKGDQKLAQSKFIDAVIAEPYAKSPWLGMKQWAESNHVRMASPPITLPAQSEPDAKGNLNINIDPASLNTPTGSAWMLYPTLTMEWRKEKFKKLFPDEKVYRHTLAEQAESLREVLTIANELKVPESKLDATFKSLIALDKDGMLECWILLNHADAGVAQDYVAYRAGHRELLHAYLDKYVIHFNESVPPTRE